MSLAFASSRSGVCKAASRSVRTTSPHSVVTKHVPPPLSRRTTFIALSTVLITQSHDRPSLADDTDTSSAKQELTDSLRQVYLNISVDRKPLGRVIIELYDDVPIGAQRFMDLAVGKEEGNSRAVSVVQNYVVNGGVSALSIIETAESPIAGGDSLRDLETELEEGRHVHDAQGVVSLIIKSTNVRPAKKKLVAVKGKFVTVEEGGGIGPNGTAFAITTSPAPELDATNLVIGRVLEGMDIIAQMRTLPTVKDNRGSVFYKAAKQIGDPRADIAEMSFGKPFNRIVVASAGAVTS